MNKTDGDLEHYVRKMVYNHIVEYPGVAFSTLKKVYDLNDSTLRYHLKYLEREGRIRPYLQGGKLYYYPYTSKAPQPNTPSISQPTYQLTQHQNLIMNTVKQYPSISQTELISKTNLKRFILSYNLSKLIDFGMIRKFNNGHSVYYEYITNQMLSHEI